MTHPSSSLPQHPLSASTVTSPLQPSDHSAKTTGVISALRITSLYPRHTDLPRRFLISLPPPSTTTTTAPNLKPYREHDSRDVIPAFTRQMALLLLAPLQLTMTTTSANIASRLNPPPPPPRVPRIAATRRLFWSATQYSLTTRMHQDIEPFERLLGW